MPHHRKFPPPPEVEVDPIGNQLHARDPRTGEYFPRYLECAAGCGWLIGCGDAVDTVTHLSCEAEAEG